MPRVAQLSIKVERLFGARAPRPQKPPVDSTTAICAFAVFKSESMKHNCETLGAVRVGRPRSVTTQPFSRGSYKQFSVLLLSQPKALTASATTQGIPAFRASLGLIRFGVPFQ
jgi:hypothetical protein